MVNRRESVYLVPTGPDLTGLRVFERPSGFLVLCADTVKTDRLRILDDALRQDVPGTDGWTWDEAGFREETFGAAFDPATYLVALQEASGEYVGLVRVWNNPKGPRLGLIGVLDSYRRRGLARFLLAKAFGVLDERGKTHVVAETDDTNVASVSLLESIGGRRVGGSLEFVLRKEAQSPRTSY